MESNLTRASEEELLEVVLDILAKEGPISEPDRALLYQINSELKRREDGRE